MFLTRQYRYAITNTNQALLSDSFLLDGFEDEKIKQNRNYDKRITDSFFENLFQKNLYRQKS